MLAMCTKGPWRSNEENKMWFSLPRTCIMMQNMIVLAVLSLSCLLASLKSIHWTVCYQPLLPMETRACRLPRRQLERIPRKAETLLHQFFFFFIFRNLVLIICNTSTKLEPINTKEKQVHKMKLTVIACNSRLVRYLRGGMGSSIQPVLLSYQHCFRVLVLFILWRVKQEPWNYWNSLLLLERPAMKGE